MQPSEERTAEPQKTRFTFKVIAICVVTGAVGISAAIVLGVRPFINRRFLPQIDRALEEALSTEVELGDITTILPWQVSLGASEIQGFASVDGIDIRTNPLSLLLKRPVAVEIELHQPDVTLIQSDDGSWQLPQLQLDNTGEPPPITLNSVELIVRRGQIRVQPRNGSTVELANIFVDGRWDAVEESVDFDVRTEFDSGRLKLVGQALLPTLELDAEAIAESVPVNALASIAPQLPLQAEGGTLDADLQLAWQLNQSPNVEGTLTLDNVSASLSQSGSLQTISNLDGQFSFHNQTIQIDRFEGNLGEIPFTSEGTVEWSDVLDWEQLKLPAPPPSESVSWVLDERYLELAYLWPHLSGVTLYQPTISIAPVNEHSDGRSNLSTQQSPEAKPGVNVTVSIPRATFQDLLDVAQVELPVPVEGAVRSTFEITGTVTNPILEGEFDSLETGAIDRVELTRYSGRFRFVDSQLTINNLSASLASSGTELGELTGTGLLSIANPLQGNIQLRVSDANADALLSLYEVTNLPVVLGSTDLSLTATISGQQVNASATWTGQGGSFPWGGNAQLALSEGVISIPNAQLQVDQGTIDATLTSSVPNSAGVRALEATISPRNLPLSLVSPQIDGFLNGDVSLQTRTDRLNLAGLRGQGQVELRQVANLGDFVAEVDWDGAALNIKNGLALDSIAVNGRIPVDSETVAIGPIALDLAAENIQLETIPALSSQPVGGGISFRGTLSGTLDNLQLAANASTTSLEVASLAFEPLQGPVNWQANQGLSLELLGSGSGDGTGADRIMLATGPDFLPTTVNIQQGITIITGDRQNELLNLQVVQLPLSLLNGTMPGYFGGTLDSTLAVNLVDRSIAGEFVAVQPHWAGLQVSRLQSDFSYENNVVTINNGQLALEGTEIEANGSVTLPNNAGSFMRGGRLVRNQPTPGQVDLYISTDNGKLENLLAGLDWDEWSDVMQSFQVTELGTAEDLQAAPILAFQRSLYDQVSAYALVVDRLSFGADDDPRIPNLSNLQGEFQGEIRLVGLLSNPIAQIDFRGSNWSLEEFAIENLELIGLFKDLQLSISTFTLETGDRSALARGTFGRDEVRGSVQVNQFPIELLQRFVPSFPSFSGDLSLTTELAGSLDNPEVEGELQIDDAMLNERSIYSVLGNYNYRNSLLELEGSLVGDSANIDNPATLDGTIPYRLPFVSVPPESDRFRLQVEAQDEELGLVNVLTDAIALQNPTGSFSVEVLGNLNGTTLTNLTLDGNLELSDTSLEMGALPEPLTNLNTNVFFNLDAIHVNNFTANFIGGEVQANGFLPLERTYLNSEEKPLEITIDPTRVQLSDLYDGNLSGDIIVSGNVLSPKISGNVDVWEGFVNIAPTETQATVTASVGTYQPPSQPRVQPEFDGFKLNFGQGLDIGWEPLFRFTATGTLALYGPLSSPQGEGTVSLTRGVITAGPAYLRLDRSWPNTAVFSREQGIDPYLNVRVFTRASEVNRPPGGELTNEVARFTGQNGQGNEFNSRNTGETRSIEIRATVQGHASELTSGLDSSVLVFSSVPSRSQSEIINLLGSEIVSNLVGNVLESTVAGSLYGGENAIGDRLGLDEARIGSFVGEDNETSLGLEVAKDLGGNVSISAETSLTDNDEDPRLGARYRINDSLLLRGRTNFDEDNRGGLEFETRF